MNERDVQDGEQRRFPWSVCFLALPILYTLGIGPAAWVYYVIEPPAPISDFLVWLYWPLEWVFESADPLKSLFEWYVGLWLPP